MISWLRALGLRIALPCLLVGSLVATHLTAPRADLPFALIEAFDRAFAVVYDAAERQVAQLESARPQPPPCDVAALLRQLDHDVAAMCELTSVQLEAELTLAGSLSLERRHAVLGCIERHLKASRRAVAEAADPDERARPASGCASCAASSTGPDGVA